MSEKKKAFVISPIGPEGSDIRSHADDVFDYIIKPAMEEIGMEAFRADHIKESGLISDQMFKAIFNYDLIIALITYKNPNVFYELGIAHYSNKAVIILLEKGNELPFDLKDLRCVFYDLKPRSLFEKVYSKELTEHVQAFIDADWVITNIIPGVNIPGSPQDIHYEFFEPDGHEYFGSRVDWLSAITKTEKVFHLMGLRLSAWRRMKGLDKAILEKAKEGCEVKILLIHPDNPALKMLIDDDASETKYEDIKRTAQENFEFYTKLASNSDNIHVKQIVDGMPTCTMAVGDEFAFYIPYFYAERSGYVPMWKCQKEAYHHKLLEKEFKTLWDKNT